MKSSHESALSRLSFFSTYRKHLLAKSVIGKEVRFIFFLQTFQNGLLLDVPMGKPQIGKPCWLVGAPALADPYRHSEDATASSIRTSSGASTTLSHPSRCLGRGLITSNDSTSTATAKSSVILPWAGAAKAVGERCSLQSAEVLTAALRDAGPVCQEEDRPRTTMQVRGNHPYNSGGNYFAHY